jgi:serine/threonine protein kinase
VYGIVYQAARRADSTAVAIKHLKFDDEVLRRYFDREIEALKAFSYPACLSYIVSAQLETGAVIVTPLQRMGTLDRALNLETATNPYRQWPTKKVIIALGIAFGMAHIHGKGYYHRDLKTANIFLNDDTEPVIGDFGLATNLTESDPAIGPTMVLGTPLHLAPELWTDESTGYTNSIDVYAYGILLDSMFVRNPELELDDGKGPAQRPRLFLSFQGLRWCPIPAETDDQCWILGIDHRVLGWCASEAANISDDCCGDGE